MFLVMYNVGNYAGYGKNTFESERNDKEILRHLYEANLSDALELRVYDMSTTSSSSYFVNIGNFAEDCNSGYIDMGSWCTLCLNLTENEAKEVYEQAVKTTAHK